MTNLVINGLPPNKPVQENFEIPYPAEFVKKDGKDVTNIVDYEMTVDIELIYMPFGERDTGTTWHKVSKKIPLEKRRGVGKKHKSGVRRRKTEQQNAGGRSSPPAFFIPFSACILN